MALHYVHKSVWSHCEICKESFCLLTHFQVESKVLFPVPIICLKRTNYWRPIACREKDGTGDSGQCWPPVWVTPHRLLGENGQGTPDPFSISTTPSTACLSHSPKCSLGVKNKYIFQKALGQNESELPRTVVIKVLESINRKFFFFFFLRLSGCLVYSPEDKSIISDKEKSCWGVRFYWDPVEETYVGNVDRLRQAVSARQAVICGKQSQGRESEPWLTLFADVSETNASTMADFKLPMTKCLHI